MKTAILCFSAPGERTARKLALTTDETVVRVAPGSLSKTVSKLWGESDALVFLSSLGIAVRASAPHLRDKAEDPAVIVVTEDGGMILPVTGCHLGGGRDLAELLAKRLGTEVLLTTSSDRAGLAAPDLLASRRNWTLLGRDSLPSVNRRLLEQGCLLWWSDIPDSFPPLPDEYSRTDFRDAAAVIISPHRFSQAPGQVRLIPRCIAAGMGCRKGIPPETLRTVLFRALEEQDLLPESLAEIRTIPEKQDEPGLRTLAAELGVPLCCVDRETLLSLGSDFTPSAASRHFGLPGAAEPCAASAGTLLGPRISQDGATAALALLSRHAGGKLSILGTGPGNGDYLTLQGRRVLEEADAVIGYRLYVELLPPEWLEGKTVESYVMGEEEKRVDRAIFLAEQGNKVVLLSGGDPVLFGLAGLALRKARGRVPAEPVPGITAAQAAGIMVGAPYVNGLVLLSLSDYLQPWKNVRRALEGAALSGLTAALYNPVKRGLGEKLAEVRTIFSSRGYSVACLVRDAGRPGASVLRIPLSELDAGRVDMRTLILLPGSSVEQEGNVLIDRRGYRTERADREGCRKT